MYKLLVADDEEEIRNGLCRFFPWDDIGFAVVGQVSNGKKALEFLLHNQVDVILCDIRMPVMDGIELAKELYERKSKIKVIFLSAYRDFEFAQTAMVYGVKNYIVKSAKFSQLVEAFRKIKKELDEEEEYTSESKEVLQEEKSSSYNERLVRKIKEYVQQNYRDVELKDIAEYIHMNPSYISKFFKQNTDQNFSEYLLEVRMEKALELLKDVRFKIYEISDMLGYSNVKNFTRSFKNYYRKSPSEYRENEILDL